MSSTLQDYRNGSEPDIYGTRVDTSGNVLDSLCISISTAINWQYEPSVIHNGTNHYFIVWADTRTGNNADIYGARVDAMGNVLDPSGIPISTASNTQYSPAAAFDGTNYFVVWTDLRSGSYSHIYGARVDTTGTVLDPSGIPISAGDYWQCYPAVAFDGTNYFVVWTDYNSGGNFYDLYGARVDVSGNVLDPAGISISIGPEDQSNPSVAFDGENYFVVWQDERNEGSLVYDIYGARVDTTGTVLDPSGIPIVTVPNSQELPSLVFDETNHLCVWQDSRDDPDFYDIYGARINTSGILIDSFIVSNQTEEQITPVLARGSGNQALITYSGFVDYINGQPANTMRIWGKLYPSVGIEETSTVNFRILKLDVFPNPFRQTTEIRYQISGVGQDFSLALKIFDATGRLVKDLSRFTAYDLRSTSITWYGDDDLGRELPAGVYFVRLESSRYKEVEKVILLR
jgi:hypothetical protein